MSKLIADAIENSSAETPYQPTLGTEVATTSGTSIDFTGIPSWAKKITLLLAGVSINATGQLLVQIGDAGGIEITGYVTQAGDYVPTANFAASTAGFIINPGSGFPNTYTVDGVIQLFLQKSSTNNWVSSHNVSCSQPNTATGSGLKPLSGTLTQVRLTTVAGTATFDAGSVNIMYE